MARSAVLFLIFNRPDLTSQTFQAIRRARPQRLYIAADGPRSGRTGDAQLCLSAREIATDVDWPCEVFTLFREKNLGCKIAVSTAIDWFFAHEEEGIILEDDCLPSESFFAFCDELLDRYRNDTRVMSIVGNNAIERPAEADSYFFSRHCRVWGWATWRRAWAFYDVSMRTWPAFRDQRKLRAWSTGEFEFERYWTTVLDRTFKGEIDTWDYQWMFATWANNGLSIRPSRNLVTNLGFGQHGTHTLDPFHPQANAARAELEFPLRHPSHVFRDLDMDCETQRVQFSKPIRRWQLLRRASGKIQRVLEAYRVRRLGLPLGTLKVGDAREIV